MIMPNREGRNIPGRAKWPYQGSAGGSVKRGGQSGIAKLYYPDPVTGEFRLVRIFKESRYGSVSATWVVSIRCKDLLDEGTIKPPPPRPKAKKGARPKDHQHFERMRREGVC